MKAITLGFQSLPSSMKNLHTCVRCLPVSAESQAWGAFVLEAGFALVPPGSPYPPRQQPANQCNWDKGRVLHSYQFFYLTHGGGTYESSPSGALETRTGDLFIVFPEVWHRYRPSPDTGWAEYRIEFDGDYVRRLMKHPAFAPEHPIHHIGIHQPLLGLFMDAVEILRRQPAENQLLLGAVAVHIIGYILSLTKQETVQVRPVEQKIREAKLLLTRREGSPIPLECIAAQFNMSYSTFRRLFKAQTGFSPRQFALGACIRRARDLIRHTDTPIHVIAEDLGFNSVNYFSRLLKHKTGLSPSRLRKGGAANRPLSRRLPPGTA
jgi:AraC-like DNA-binding protein